ncbi:MAG: DUF1501 domain-containing protein [Gemmataceae bacterium]|nr:DUF1501 domain-containing protein [Gemmataceae bacterium]
MGAFPANLIHPKCNRRQAIQAGAVGLVGMGMNHLSSLRAAPMGKSKVRAKSVVYIFLSGGLSQIDSFDPKPDAPEMIRGEFKPIQTKTPGLYVCEHLPLLAARSNKWSLLRSLTHPSNDHSAGHQIMLSGRADLPPGFDRNKPKNSDWPAIVSVAGYHCPSRNNLPPAVVLPDRNVHNSGRVIPGQFGGQMGSRYDPWFIEAASFDPRGYGAFPEFDFDHQERPHTGKPRAFQIPNLTIPDFLLNGRMENRVQLMKALEGQLKNQESNASFQQFDRYHQGALSLLADQKVRRCFDLSREPARKLERYGQNAFGWSLLMARNLVETGVSLVQVNLGNNETWDTHGNAFPHLKEKLFPPTDKSLSAFLDDMEESGLLNQTLIVMAGEFGRTPKISSLPNDYKLPGRDHWGAVQSVFFAGGGIPGGLVVGSSDKTGGYPATEPHTPENFAATIYNALGIPNEAVWFDSTQRPSNIYHGTPIPAFS